MGYIIYILQLQQPFKPCYTLMQSLMLQNKILGYSLLVGVFLSFFACQDSEDISATLLENDLLSAVFTDSLTIQAKLVESDPLNISSLVNGNVMLLGGTNDPLVGKSSASICMQFALGLGQNNLQFDSLPTIDSVVLSLDYANSVAVYGDSIQEQGFTIYEIADSLFFFNESNEVIDYYSDIPCDIVGEVGNGQFIIGRDSTLVETGDTSYYTIPVRVDMRLDDELGQRFLDAFVDGEDQKKQAIATGNEPPNGPFDNIVTFLDFFKGLAIVPDDGNTTIMTCNLLSSNTRMTLYYKSFYPVSPDSIEYGQRVRPFTVRTIPGTSRATALNYFAHDHNGTEAGTLLENGGMLNETAYLQAMSGLEMELSFPGLHDLGDIFINKAELIINSEPDDERDTAFPRPFSIAYRLFDTNNSSLGNGAGNYETVLDLDEVTVATYQYRIPITIAMQRIVEFGDENTKLSVRLFEDPLNPFRVKINGPNAPEFPMKLNLYYSELNQ